MNADKRRRIIDQAGVGSALISDENAAFKPVLNFEAVRDEHKATAMPIVDKRRRVSRLVVPGFDSSVFICVHLRFHSR